MLSPIKQFMPDYKAAEKRCQAVVYQAFGLPEVTPPRVKIADYRLLKTERDQIMASTSDPWLVDSEQPLPIRIGCWSAVDAEKAFLDRFRYLTR